MLNSPCPPEASAPQRKETGVFRESPGFEKQLAQPQRNRSPLLSLLQGNRPKPPSRGRWIREVAPGRTKPEGVHPVAWLTVPLLICCCATCTFSPARKYQRASGVAKFSLEIATPDPLRSNLELFPSFFAPIASRGRAAAPGLFRRSVRLRAVPRLSRQRNRRLLWSGVG